MCQSVRGRKKRRLGKMHDGDQYKAEIFLLLISLRSPLYPPFTHSIVPFLLFFFFPFFFSVPHSFPFILPHTLSPLFLPSFLPLTLSFSFYFPLSLRHFLFPSVNQFLPQSFPFIFYPFSSFLPLSLSSSFYFPSFFSHLFLSFTQPLPSSFPPLSSSHFPSYTQPLQPSVPPLSFFALFLPQFLPVSFSPSVPPFPE